MENNFFIPIGKEVLVKDVCGNAVRGILQGFITFGGIPSLFLVKNAIEDTDKIDIIVCNHTSSLDFLLADFSISI
jgi:hypothetical protein